MAKSSVESIAAVPTETPSEVIGFLEGLLERARRERIDSIGVVVVGRDQLTYETAGHRGLWLLAGASRLHHELNVYFSENP